jgi:hypothetical protein
VCVRRLLSSVGVFGLLLALNTKCQEKITVGPNAHVSLRNSDRMHHEVRIAADPANAEHLLACSMIDSGEQNSVHSIVYASSNGGREWTPTLEDDQSDNVDDPDCVFGVDGKAYFASLSAVRSNLSTLGMFVRRSPDGGWTWDAPVALPFVDREYLTVDHTQGRYRGRIYLNGAGSGMTVDGHSEEFFTLFRSTDGGLAFQPPVRLLWDENHVPTGNGSGEVLSDGTYVAVFPELSEPMREGPSRQPSGTIKLVRSGNGGDSFAKADVVSPWYACKFSFGLGPPMIAVDHTDGPFKDRLYIVWGDKQSGHCDIRFAYSDDQGKTWCPSKVVNHEPDRNSPGRKAEHDLPVVAVNNRGVVGISWYDRRDSPDDFGWWTRFTASVDGGETFLPSVRVSEAPQSNDVTKSLPILVTGYGGGLATRPTETITTKIELNPHETFGGDTAGMAADANGIFHPVWVDNRTGVVQVWTTAVSVDAKAIRNGSPDLAVLADVTQHVALNYTNVKYEPKTRILSVVATLVNTSTVPISVPIKLRVIGMAADSGTAQIMNADNGQGGTGAVWDFSELIRDGRLESGERSGTKRFVFRLADLHPFQLGANGFVLNDLISLESKVLAKGPSEDELSRQRNY